MTDLTSEDMTGAVFEAILLEEREHRLYAPRARRCGNWAIRSPFERAGSSRQAEAVAAAAEAAAPAEPGKPNIVELGPDR